MSNVASSNFTSLYNSNAVAVVPAMPYGNANVVGLLNTGTDGANTVGNIDAAGIISATGNIATGGYFIGDGSFISNLPGGSYGNANVEALLATYNGPITGSTVSATGNITGSYFVGNGSLLTGITGTGTYGNANVAAFLPTYTGNIAGGNITVSGAVSGATVAGNGAALSSLTGANVTGTVANATFATTAGAATTAGTVTTAAQPNITSVGTMTSITSTGNIAGNYFVGNGSLLTGISGTGTYGNANVVSLLSAFGSNTISTTGSVTAGTISAPGNITGGNINTAAAVSAQGTIQGQDLYAWGTSGPYSGNIIGGVINSTGSMSASGNVTIAGNVSGGNISTGGNINLTGSGVYGHLKATGNIQGNYFVGNGSLLTGISGSGTYGNANVAAFLPTYTGELTGGNITTPGAISATGAVTGQGGLFTSSQLIVGTSINAASITATGNITGGNLKTGGNVIATNTVIGAAIETTGTSGNITGANYITANYFVGNGSFLTSVPTTPTPAGGSPTQVQYARSDSTFGGMAYMTYNDSNGNIAIQNTLLNTANVITTVQPFNDALQSATVTNPGRIQIGTGYNSNTSASVDPSNWNRGALVDIFQNITKGDNGRRTTPLNVEMPIELTANIANSSTRLSAGRQALQIGGGANAYSMTSTNLSAWPSGLNTGVRAGNDGNILVGNVAMTGAVAINGSLDTGGTSTIATGLGLRQQFNGLFTTTTGMITQVSLNAPGTLVSVLRNESAYHNANARSSTDYLFLNNGDNAAQNKMGSLRTYHELNYTGNNTSGDVYISKNNGQVQQITPTGTITAMYFSDFVVSASDGVNTDQQADTVTVIIAQGATAYTVTMPSGSTYKYSGGTNTVSTTANSVTMISITAVNISGVTTYLITISPGFV